MTRNDIKWCAVGAGIGVTVLSLLAAVPSQTDFDPAYFRTNALPVTIVGNLTNWSKLATNSAPGLWFGDTNTVQYQSQSGDAATNYASIVDTANYWTPTLWDNGSSPTLLALRNQGTNQAVFLSNGGLSLGRNVNEVWGNWAGNFKESLLAIKDVANGDDDFLLAIFGITGELGSNLKMNNLKIQGDTTQMYLQVSYNAGPTNAYVKPFASNTECYIDLSYNGNMVTQIDPNYGHTFDTIRIFGPSDHDGDGALMTVRNSTTNKFQVIYNGSVHLFGTTNQVIFGATNTAPVSSAAPTKWISVQVTGESTVYRLPLYQ